MKIKLLGFAFLCCCCWSCISHRVLVGPQPDGSIVVPTHQVLRPAGRQIEFFGRPTVLAVHPERDLLAVQNYRELLLIDPNLGTIGQSIPMKSTWSGIEWTEDGRHLYVTNAKSQLVRLDLDEPSGLLLTENPLVITFRAKNGKNAGVGGFCFAGNGKTACVALSRNNSLAVTDLADGSYIEIPVGIAPYTAIKGPGNKVFVSNWGGRHPEEGKATDNSSGTEVEVDERGIAASGTLSIVDLAKGEEIKQIETGLHPSGMALSPDGVLYVACANSDEIMVIDTMRHDVVERISARPDPDFPFGSAPNALCVSKDGKTLYVANGGNNAVAVVDLSPEPRIAGQIPTGWYPGDVKLDRKGDRLYVANVKGTGSRTPPASRDGFNSKDYTGSISVIPVPNKQRLAEYTGMVDRNNDIGYARLSLLAAQSDRDPVPVPERHGEPGLFKHVVYIIKENRTYDQIFGDMPEGNGDPSLVHFGEEVTPNHHKLAREFVLFDNFYCSGILSADGHQWTNEAYVTDYIEKQFGGWVRSYPYWGNDPLAFASSGFLWDNALEHGLSFRTYGEFVKAYIDPKGATFLDCYRDFMDGTNKIKIRAESPITSLNPYVCKKTIGFPSVVPDVYRADVFIKELKEFEENGRFPNLCMMLLPNDHTTGTRPNYPTPRASVADNDLALGRIVDAVSHSRYWKETCIFVVQDDPQAGVDHVDGHRTVALVISPYTKRGFVDSTMYTQPGMVKTIELQLGLPPMNINDLSAVAMRDCFTETPDYTPYDAVPNNIPLDEMNPKLSSLSGPKRRWAELSMAQPLDEIDMADEDTLNRILWHAVKGDDVPYPRLAWMDKYEELD